MSESGMYKDWYMIKDAFYTNTHRNTHTQTHPIPISGIAFIMLLLLPHDTAYHIPLQQIAGLPDY